MDDFSKHRNFLILRPNIPIESSFYGLSISPVSVSIYHKIFLLFDEFYWKQNKRIMTIAKLWLVIGQNKKLWISCPRGMGIQMTSFLRGEWPSSPASSISFSEVKHGCVRSETGWVTFQMNDQKTAHSAVLRKGR